MLTYLGPDQVTARWAEARARAAGLSMARARVIGHYASFRDAWLFRRTIAEAEGISVRTVQRASTQGKAEGLMLVWRGKKNEVPPGAEGPIPCGWSHHVTVGRDLAGEAMRAAVAKAKLAALMRHAQRKALRELGARSRGPSVPHAPQPRRGLTPEQRAQIEKLEAEERAELERLAAEAIAATRSRAGPGDHN